MAYPEEREKAILLDDIASVKNYCLENQEKLIEELGSQKRNGQTILYIAAKYDKTGEIMKLLIEACKGMVDLNKQDEEGCTASHYAALSGKLFNLQLLIENGANIFICTREQKSILNYVTSEAAIETAGEDIQKEIAYYLLANFAGLYDRIGPLRSKLSFANVVVIVVVPLHEETRGHIDQAITISNYKE